MRIRPATAAELPALQDIERAAGLPFRDLGMPEIADDEPPALDELERFRGAGRCWVAVDEREDPVAYLVAEPVDGALHIEQVSVHPRAARRGVGRVLLAYAAERAREEGLAALTLTLHGGSVERPLLRPSRLPHPHGGRAHPRPARDPRDGGRTRPRPPASRVHARTAVTQPR
ncbi:hypothetical protein SVIOM74S_03403 [Streptomyces violarus]